MTTLSFSTKPFMAIGIAVALLGCGGGGEVSEASATDSTRVIAAHHAASAPESNRRIQLGRGSKETLLIGTTNQTIVQVEPMSGRVMATLNVDVDPSHIAADETAIFFGGAAAALERYDVSTQEVVRFAFSDGFTRTVGMAIAPSGTLFASNLYVFIPDTSCGTCSTVVAYPEPNGINPEGRINYFFGYVRDPASGEGRLSGQQIGFTDEARLLVASAAGDGIFVSTVPVAEICCAAIELDFTLLIQDDTHTTVRFARRGHKKLLVLRSSGRIDEHDLATGRLEKNVLQAGMVDPIEMTVSHDGSVYVLSASGQIRAFSERGREFARITLPATAGRAVSMALCCDRGQRTHGRD